MNYLNSLFNQTRDLFLSLTPQARLMAILMAVVICVSAGFLVRGTTTTAKEKLFSGYVFTDQELKNAQIALSTAKLSDWEVNGNQLLVPKALRDVYLKALGEGRAFPAELGTWTDKAIEGGTIFDGNAKTLARMRSGKQKDLGEAISKNPSIEYAWVSYDEQREGFARDIKKTASIFVMPSNSLPLPEPLKQSIMRSVQASFAGLRYEDITLMDLSNGLSLNGSDDPNNSDQSKFLAFKRQYEIDLKKKALNLLSDYATDNGDVKVEVTAEVDDMIRKASEMVKLDKPTAIQTTSTTKSIESAKAGTGGRPGAEPNVGPNRTASLATQGESSSKTKEVSEGAKMQTGKENILTETAGYTLKNATFAVKIPRGYYDKLWKNNNPDKKDTSPTEIDVQDLHNGVARQIQEQLAVLLPPSPLVDKGANKYDRVNVSYYLDTPGPELPKASMAESALAWLASSWQTLALLGVSLFAIMALRSAVVAQPKAKDEEFSRGFGVQIDETIVGGDISALMKEQDSDSDEAGTAQNEDSPVRRFNMTGETVREELTQIVRDNPSAAVNIIRNWIGDAA